MRREESHWLRSRLIYWSGGSKRLWSWRRWRTKTCVSSSQVSVSELLFTFSPTNSAATHFAWSSYSYKIVKTFIRSYKPGRMSVEAGDEAERKVKKNDLLLVITTVGACKLDFTYLFVCLFIEQNLEECPMNILHVTLPLPLIQLRTFRHCRTIKEENKLGNI